MPAAPSLIDLDHNATTRPTPEVIETVARSLREAWGNPGSRHAAGRAARRILEDARETLARILHALPEEVVFTSGGTEATNLALLGAAAGAPGVIVLPPGEHPATEQTVRALEFRGWRRHTFPIDDEGRLLPDHGRTVPWGDVRLATALLAHNETGVLQDLGPLAAECRARNIPLHVDAVQAVGKVDVDFHALGATTLALGAHKFHGPRGIGALLVRSTCRLAPAAYGGHQEAGRRPGTECVALAAGMAVALHRWHEDRQQRTAFLLELRQRLETGLTARCPPVIVNGSPAHRLPNTLHVTFPGVDGEALLVALDLAGLCVSLGTTCASGSTEPAPILLAMGRSQEDVRASIRLSVGIDNTAEEMDAAVDRISAIIRQLRGER
jgi:cysteine desulfurase